MRRKRALLSLFVVAILSLIAVPTAFAGSTSGGGFGTGTWGSGEAADRFNWYTEWDSNYREFDCRGTTYGDGNEQASLAQHARDEGTSTYSRLISYATTRKGAYDNGELRYIWTTKGAASWENPNNWGCDAYSLPSELRDPNLTNEYCYCYDGILHRDSDGNPVSAIWIDPNKEWVTKSDATSKTVLVYCGGTDSRTKETEVYHDITSLSAKDKFEDGTQSATYEHTTLPNETSVTNTITTKVQIVTQIHTYKYKASTGEVKDESYTYTEEAPTTQTKTIRYVTENSDPVQIKYCPLSLNRNGRALVSDGGLTTEYANAELLSATVDNNVSITDGSPIPSLDINSDNVLSLKFGNSCFGLPTTYDWGTSVPSLDEGTYELVSSDEYCNGKYSSNSDGSYRYDLTFNASINGDTTACSIYDITRKKEAICGEKITYEYDSSNPEATFMGSDNDFSARFTSTGAYNTCSSSKSSWWTDSYVMARTFEYGTHYKGIATVSKINDPSVVSYGTGNSNADGSYTISVDASHEVQQRAIYVGVASLGTVEQPVLYGTWKVSTVAGYIS